MPSKEFAPRNVPEQPGVYLFKDGAGRIIYIGKAKNLKKRVMSYFHNKALDNKTLKMVEQVRDADFILTRNEVEALILEANLVKKHKPRYNLDLKEGTRYPWVRITSDKFPRLEVVRGTRKEVQGQRDVFGPFTEGSARHKILTFIEKSFGIRICKTLPKRACLQYHLGYCPAPCIGKIEKEEYAKRVQKARLFLQGKQDELKERIEKELAVLSKKHMFEQAIPLRDALLSLERFATHQSVDLVREGDVDVLAYGTEGEKMFFSVLRLKKGTLLHKEFVEARTVTGGKGKRKASGEAQTVADFLKAFYSVHRAPGKLVVERGFPKGKKMEKMLNKDTRLVRGPRGDLKKLLELARANLEEEVRRETDPGKALQEALALPVAPDVVEGFDISHLGGTETVASMVRFSRGKPVKSSYRRFKIHTVSGGDDPGAMEEVVRRRYGATLAKKMSMPDMVIVDGGKPQLNAARNALAGIRVKIPVVSLAKRKEEVYVPARRTPLKLALTHPGLRVLIAVRDEAHRFANAYQRKRRQMAARRELKS